MVLPSSTPFRPAHLDIPIQPSKNAQFTLPGCRGRPHLSSTSPPLFVSIYYLHALTGFTWSHSSDGPLNMARIDKKQLYAPPLS